MGTNYYVILNKCDCCNRHDRLHIGKKSIGWQFSFHGTTDLRSWQDWKILLLDGKSSIIDEYEESITSKQFIEMVENSKNKGRNHFDECCKSYAYWEDRIEKGIEWKDKEGWSFTNNDFS